MLANIVKSHIKRMELRLKYIYEKPKISRQYGLWVCANKWIYTKGSTPREAFENFRNKQVETLRSVY